MVRKLLLHTGEKRLTKTLMAAMLSIAMMALFTVVGTLVVILILAFVNWVPVTTMVSTIGFMFLVRVDIAIASVLSLLYLTSKEFRNSIHV